MKVSILGVPMDLGASRRGVDMGPSAIRYAHLEERLEALGADADDLGNVDVPIVETVAHEDESGLRCQSQILSVCALLEEACLNVHRQGRLPLVLGGDHSLAMGSVRATSQAHPGSGLLWIDAHSDINTAETSPSGNIHGMPVAALLGMMFYGRPAIDPKRTVMVGIRSVDPGERRILQDRGITVYTMHEIDRYGMARVMEQALARVGKDVHVSFDLDSLDPTVAPGVGTPVRGGLSLREAYLAMEMIAEAGVMRALDMVELNPIMDRSNTTGELAVSLIAAALGERIF
ncbi:MAG: arginase [Bacillota bacterium]